MSLNVVVKDIDLSIRHDWALRLAEKVFLPESDLEISKALVDLYKSKEDADWSVSITRGQELVELA